MIIGKIQFNNTADQSINVGDKENEILHILQEECAEVIQAISKCFRFGINNINPNTNISNIKSLELEIGDMLAMIDLLKDYNIVHDENIEQAKQNKFIRLKKWSNIYYK